MPWALPAPHSLKGKKPWERGWLIFVKSRNCNAIPAQPTQLWKNLVERDLKNCHLKPSVTNIQKKSSKEWWFLDTKILWQRNMEQVQGRGPTVMKFDLH